MTDGLVGCWAMTKRGRLVLYPAGAWMQGSHLVLKVQGSRELWPCYSTMGNSNLLPFGYCQYADTSHRVVSLVYVSSASLDGILRLCGMLSVSEVCLKSNLNMYTARPNSTRQVQNQIKDIVIPPRPSLNVDRVPHRPGHDQRNLLLAKPPMRAKRMVLHFAQIMF